jgi:hypothetical protein
MKKFVLLFLLCTSLSAVAQERLNIKLAGKVQRSSKHARDPHIYYKVKGKSYQPAQKLKLNGDKFSFDLQVSKLKVSESDYLLFSADTRFDTACCTHEIRIGNIIRYMRSKKLNVLSLKTDLMLSVNEVQVRGEEERISTMLDFTFAGKYERIAGDTVSIMQFRDSDFKFYGYSTTYDKELMNEWVGSWTAWYDPKKKGLVHFQLNTQYKMNKDFGTRLTVRNEEILDGWFSNEEVNGEMVQNLVIEPKQGRVFKKLQE